VRGARRVTNSDIDDVRSSREEAKDIRTTRGKVRGFDLRDTAEAVNEGGKKTNKSIVTDTAEVLETRTSEEMIRTGVKVG